MTSNISALQKLENHFKVNNLTAIMRTQLALKEQTNFEYFDDMAKFFDGSDYTELFFAYETLDYLCKVVGLNYEEKSEVIAYTLAKNITLLNEQFKNMDENNIRNIQNSYYEYFGKSLNATEIAKLVSQTIINISKYISYAGNKYFLTKKDKQNGVDLLSNTIFPIKEEQIENLIYDEDEFEERHSDAYFLEKARNEILIGEQRNKYIDALVVLYDDNVDELTKVEIAKLISEINYLLLSYNKLSSEQKIMYKSLIDYSLNEIMNIINGSSELTRKFESKK